jgi:hypothetical protein
MTYTEAEKLINDNQHLLDQSRIQQNPPHYILGCIICTKNRLYDKEQFIFIECIENNKNNKDVLLDLSLLSEDLTPFVIIKMWGDKVIIHLESYLSSTLGKDL